MTNSGRIFVTAQKGSGGDRPDLANRPQNCCGRWLARWINVAIAVPRRIDGIVAPPKMRRARLGP
jgi:hypothetical protein